MKYPPLGGSSAGEPSNSPPPSLGQKMIGRRPLLQASLAAALAAPLSDPRPRRGAGAERLRVGLIGCGGRGTGAALQALLTKGEIALVAMGDAFEDRLEGSFASLEQQVKEREDLQGRLDAPKSRRFFGVDAFEKVLAQDLDLVILATPPHFRPAHFEAAIAANCHVFMEKPVAVDGPGIRQVLAAGELATKKGLKVVVGLQRHYQAGYLAALKEIHAGRIGRIVAAHCYWNMGTLWHKERQGTMSDLEWQMRNWLYFTWLSGDHIVEQHVHNLDVVNWFVGAYPVKAHGMGGRQVRTDAAFGHIFDHHAVHYEYADGTFLSSQCRQIAGCREEVAEHLIGTEGRAHLDSGRWTITRHDGEVWRYQGKNTNPYQVEHDELVKAIREDLPKNDTEFGAYSTLTAIMGRMATYSGREVGFEEALKSDRREGPNSYDFAQSFGIPPVPVPGT